MINAKTLTRSLLIPKALQTLLSALAFCAFQSGCGTQAEFTPLPIYTTMSDQDSLQRIAARQSAINTVSARCDLVLTDPQGQTVNLDGALLIMPVTTAGPKVRLRAWKLGQTVFDITLTNGEAWLIAPDNPRIKGPDNTTGPVQISRRIAEALDFIGPEFFESAAIVSSTPTSITAKSATANFTQTICVIDRATLIPQRFTAGDQTASAGLISEIFFYDYRLIGGIPWAHRLHLTSPGGTVVVNMSDVELNAELPPSAFVPPARAKQLP